MPLWGGRFEGGPDPLFTELNDSLPFDFHLALDDIEGSIAWARAIHGAGVLSVEETARLTAALEALRREVQADPAAPLRRAEGSPRDEDIHSWVERRLIEAVGPLGKKLHTGRSRNDQVATDLRLWTRRAIGARLGEVRAARSAIVAFAREQLRAGVIIPGYTHLQRGQPVLLAHWAMAYDAMLARDAARLRDCLARVNVCPLGSGALAGTAYQIDREALARDLGFARPSENSMDAVGDRDFVLETLAALAVLGVHLSRLGEDLVLYGSGEFAFFEYDDAFSSGSSLMPQKKNPDAAELLRGKAGRAVGALVGLLTTMKGLPLAYNKDLQEDKEPLLDAMRQAGLCLRAAARVFGGISVRREACAAASRAGHANATELADYLVGRGVAFRDAHEQVGRLVRAAIEQGKALEDLPLDALRAHAPACEPDVYDCLPPAAAVDKRRVAGGTAPEAVERAIAAALADLERA
jgi:argininosuccinate lyase